MHNSRQIKNTVYPELARIGKALASPARLEILDLLGNGPKTVEAIAGNCDLAFANASQHLKVLRQARLVEADKRGTYVEYRLASPDVAGFLVAMRHLGESRLTEIIQVTREFVTQRDDMERLEPRKLLKRVRNGEVLLLDVRPAAEYAASHLPGATSIPVDELKKRIKELPQDREIVAYCRGPYCLMAVEAVDLLRKRGLQARRSELGVSEWHALGLPIESSSIESKTP
jgi:rhodanese-related sulfurtransferase